MSIYIIFIYVCIEIHIHKLFFKYVIIYMVLNMHKINIEYILEKYTLIWIYNLQLLFEGRKGLLFHLNFRDKKLQLLYIDLFRYLVYILFVIVTMVLICTLWTSSNEMSVIVGNLQEFQTEPLFNLQEYIVLNSLLN